MSLANTTTDREIARRAVETVRRVLPRSAVVRPAGRDSGADLIVGGRPLQIKWAGEGSLGDVRAVLGPSRPRPDIVVARHLSPGARRLLTDEGVGWVDETGAAEIAFGTVVVSRTGRVMPPVEAPKRWTPAVSAIAEALLCGTKATVSETVSATGLSVGTCTTALRVLTDLGLLDAKAQRGRDSARKVSDPRRLLEAYAAAVDAAPRPISLQVGAVWRDPVAGVVDLGRQWNKVGVAWAATGAAAASVLAPYLTNVTSTEVYVDADTLPALEAIAIDAGLRPLEGGRLTLRPFPTVAVRRLARDVDGLRTAPWPRVYVDLRSSGVRGEEAAEHLREVIDAR